MGCTHFASKQSKIGKKLDVIDKNKLESVQVWITGANDSLSLVAPTNQTKEVKLAKKYTGYAQDIVGIPKIEDRINVVKILDDSSKLNIRQVLERQIELKKEADRREADARFQELEIRLKEQELVINAKLQAMGTKYEEEHNKKIWWNIFGWSTGTLIIAGIIALCVFFPPAIPIVLGAIKWILSKFVSLLKYLVPAFFNTIKGISTVRETLKTEAETNKTLPLDKQITYTPSEILEFLGSE